MTAKENSIKSEKVITRLQNIIRLFELKKLDSLDNWDFNEIDSKLMEIEKRIIGRVKK